MTPLSAIFAKPIDRPIEGVIKADDEASLRQEVEEYVLTKEAAQRLESFLFAYNNYSGANGVWISGFFGSGKSHLLKMLALLLENRPVEGAPMLDLFLPKCGDNEILRGDLKRAVAIPSRSILFNIDQKADVISKTQIDALLAVFMKVFDEMCGYYGKQGHIARFERDLDSRGLYQAFKQAYQQKAGYSWERGREQALLEGSNIAAAYAQVTSTSSTGTTGILDKYRAEYKVSIEDFAEQVQAYIAQQPSNFRLNFFVDEVGQYVANNTKLMTNLQTVAESLATKCRGRAWIIVTAQEDMATVFGDNDNNQQQSNDFSKIQARFKNRMKLTSADVAEVIEKRLLLKNDRGIEQLSRIYADQHNNFKTLFDFADGAQTYQNFRDRDQFVHRYPFAPYQFTLFQTAIQSLSVHNAFEGKHSSVGERSMLGVFQQVAMFIANQETGQLATFDLMFEGIRTALKSNIQRAVINAEQNLEHKYAVKVLKALFLVKYVKEFRATLRNLTVLMYPAFGTDLPRLREQLEEALNILEQQTYVQRNGDQYAYLTDEEKDVEEEIKHTEVDVQAVADELGKLVFEHVIKERKIHYDANGQDYPFTRKLDGRSLGREYELAIHVISPFHEHAGNETILRAQAMGRDELLVLMPASDRLVRDLLMFKRTEKYVMQNQSATQQGTVQRILTEKLFQNNDRRETLRQMVADLLGQAKLIAASHDLDMNGGDAQTRIVKGFHELIRRSYPHLGMLHGFNYNEADVGQHLRPQTTLFGAEPPTFSEAEQEILSFIQAEHRQGVRTTMQALDNRFERKPYGWYLAAVQCNLAKLIARGKIELRRDGALVGDNDLERAIRNTHGFANLILEPQIDFTTAQVRQLRDFYADFFDGPPHANEAKTLAQETMAALRTFHQELTTLHQQTSAYPFLTALAVPLERLQPVLNQSYAFYLTELRQHENALLDLKEQVIDPIRRFMGGTPKQIYDEARLFLNQHEANFAYVEGDAVTQIRTALNDPACYRGNQMQQVKTLVDGLRPQLAQRVTQEKEQTLAKVDERWERLAGMNEFAVLTSDQQAQLQRPFAELKRLIERQTLIAVIRDTLHRFDDREYQDQLRQMALWAQPAPIAQPQPSTGGKVLNEPRVEPLVEVEYMALRDLNIPFNKAWLADDADADAYLSALKQALRTAIQSGKRIRI